MTGGSLPTHPRSPTSSESRQPEEFVLTLWTDDPVLAGRADGAGIQRVGLDLETLGKLERQHGLGTWISPHRIDRLPVVRASLKRAQLFARVGAHNRFEILQSPAGERPSRTPRTTAS